MYIGICGFSLPSILVQFIYMGIPITIPCPMGETVGVWWVEFGYAYHNHICIWSGVEQGFGTRWI